LTGATFASHSASGQQNMIKIEQAHKEFIDNLGSQGKSSATLIAYSKDIEQLMDHLSKEGIDLVSQIELQHLEILCKN
jgi:site-specific recombinase XerD